MSKERFIQQFENYLPRGIHSALLKDQTAPQATWASTAEIVTSRAMTYVPDAPEGKILVGALGPKLVGIYDPRHVMTIAGSQTGKSVLLTANLLATRASVLCTDIKGELANRTARRRLEMGQRVHVLDPFGITTGTAAQNVARYNPMHILTPNNPTVVEDAGSIAEALVVSSGHEKDPHWDESARNFIEGVILHVATNPAHRGQRTLVSVDECLKRALTPAPGQKNPFGDPVMELDVEMMKSAEKLADPVVASAIRGATRDFYDKGPNERGSVLSTLRRHTRFLSYGSIRQSLSGHDFSLRDLKTEAGGVTVYLCLPAGKLGICHRWFRLIVNQFFQAMETVRGMPATGCQTLLALDEFAAAIGRLKIIETAAGLVAGDPYHVKMWTILQDLNQLRDLYNQRWESFMGNAGIVQAFALNDWTTADYLSRRLGRTPVESGYVESRNDHPIEIRRQETHPLMSPEEIMLYFARGDSLQRQIVIWPDIAPMVMQRVRYFDPSSAGYSWFKDKWDR